MVDEYDAYVEPVKVQKGRPAPVSPDDFDLTRASIYTVLWFDPGSTTGWCIVSIWRMAVELSNYRILSNIAAWSLGEFVGPEGSIVDQMMGLVDAWDGDLDAVGLEDFILRQFSMGRELLAPVRISSRFQDRLYTSERSGLLVPAQQPSLAMSTVTDDRLKTWGLYAPTAGKPHARDALRHALTFLRRLKAASAKG